MVLEQSCRGMRPSSYEDPRPLSNACVSKDYPFSRRINRLHENADIEFLFDELTTTSRGRKNGPKEYYGTISGIEVKIDFSANRPCFVYAKSEQELGQVYNRILDILINEN